MKIFLSTFCYVLDSLKSQSIANFIRNDLGFESARLRTDKFLKNGGKINDRWLKKLEGTDEFQTIEIESPSGPGGPGLLYSQFPAWGFEVIYLRNFYKHVPEPSLMAKMTSMRGFTFASCADSDDVQWQNEQSVSNYELSKRPHQHMPKVYDPTRQKLMIDVKQNPGRRSLFPGMWLQSAWRMWYGEPSFRYMPPQRLLGFAEAEEVRQLDSGVIFVQLYADGNDFDNKQNRARQAVFRKWTGMDVYENQASSFLGVSGLSDPPHEMKFGKFPHGGDMHYTEWLDECEQLTRRSKAVFKRESEYDSKFKSVWVGDKVDARQSGERVGP